MKKNKCTYIMLIITLLTVTIQTFALPLENEKMKIYLSDRKENFDIVGLRADGAEFKTTYGKYGYTSFVKVNGKEHELSLKDSLTNVVDGIEISFKPKFFSESYFEILYEVKNTTKLTQTISLGFDADVQIADNDRAAINKLPDDKGFTMTDGVHTFTLLCKNIPGRESVDSYWFGSYGSRRRNRYTQIEIDSLVNTDSGMALSWHNRELKPGETKTFSVLIGVGDATSVEIFTEHASLGDNTQAPLSVVALAQPSDMLRIVDATTNRIYYEGTLREKINVPIPNGEGQYSLKAQIISGGSVLANSSTVKVERRNVLNRVLELASLKNTMEHFILVDEKDRYFEDNATNRALVSKIKSKADGIYLIYSDVSPVLNALLER